MWWKEFPSPADPEIKWLNHEQGEMGLGLILDSTKDDEPDPYTHGYGGYLVSDPICFFLKITFAWILFILCP